jgi:hypothetical protein
LLERWSINNADHAKEGNENFGFRNLKKLVYCPRPFLDTNRLILDIICYDVEKDFGH